MRCPSCGGVSHPATGSVLPSGEVVCGPCVRRFWSWASEHGKKTYRVGKKGKGSKYIAFPTGITKKNPAERDCIKCGGSGRIPRFGHYAEGVCFDCGGTGVARKGGRRRGTLTPAAPQSVEKRIKYAVYELRTMWRNYTVYHNDGQLDELWFMWSSERFEREWDQFVHGDRTTKPEPASIADGKKRWQSHAQFFLDELRKLGAGAKADEIAQQFQSRLRVPVRNSRRRTSRNPYYHATRSDLAEKILREHKLKAHPSAKYGGRPAVFAGDTRSPRMADAAMKWADTRHMYHYTGSPDEETVLIEFDAREPDDRRGLTGKPDPDGDEAVWFGDLDLVRPRIVRRRKPELAWNRRRTSRRRTSRR